ncbi:alpha,alpha-trehalose-phosphate synthase (UDP-forming) [Oleisolibacter albus]|uniref:alpha,alpha-trehalose-phosphate synthase (UDP-forming) n=1 Tax=Oleisolibacter albus TaxID=2171757 RepID=UPI000DF3B8AC|nr:alpha,alpha-trehalose-phosphate synthase (UDP-forming) [Oleisolibacter albus]
MSRLVVVSNRVAPVEEGKSQAGGLAVAIQEALKSRGGIWFGWNGDTVEQTPDAPGITQNGRITYATLGLLQRDLEEYYNGFANSTLWPLFHYRLDLAQFSGRTYAGYQRVNSLFASRLAPLLRADDLIWVHDYHLIPFAEQLRSMGLEQTMGFFLHTPWPAPEILGALPAHEALVRNLCAYDLLGFHTEVDLRCFANYIRYEAQGTVEELGAGQGLRIGAFGRSVIARAFPISIDTATLEGIARQAADTAQMRRLKESLVGRALIVGVDRLDYSKGLPQRFESFHALLDAYPANRGQVSFMQVAPPSRSDVAEYQAIRRELEALAGHINGRFAEFDWVPIRYLNKSFSRKALAGFYRHASIGLVTPLRDGMNLVAKEYVACQPPEDPGVLVLSRFAGAAKELDGALIVNPYDIRAVAENMQRGLTMPLQERRERYEAMMKVLRANDITHWRESYVEALSGVAGQA